MKHRDLDPGDPLPADFIDALNEFMSAGAFNFAVIVKPTDNTVLQVPAAAGNGQASIGIQKVGDTTKGGWRYVAANVERASPGGAAQTFDVFVTATDNVFTPGDPETDSTDYSFALAIVATGMTPSGVALARKVATAVWDGTKFTSVDVLVGPDLGVLLGQLAAGVHIVWGGDTNLYRAAADFLQTDDSFVVGGNVFVHGGTIFLGAAADVNLYRSGANALKTDDSLTVDGGFTANSAVAMLAALHLASATVIDWAGDTNLYRSGANALKTDDALDVEGVITQAGSALYEPGDLKASARATPSTGWLACDGSAVLRTGANAALFAAIGTTYGVGDGSTTFNVPDLRGRAPVGPDGSAGRLSANDALGQSAGEEKHVLVTGELASHSHGLDPGGLGQLVPTADSGWSDITVASAGAAHVPTFGGTLRTLGATQANGSGTAHNNMPPYQVVNWFVKL